MPPGKRRKEEAAVHRPSITPSEFALFCWLRRNPKVAATYGIEKCDGETTIGSMLLQTLDSQGMDVKWHLQVPNGAITDESTSNEKGAALIKSVSRRPGARMKQLSQRPCVAPPSNAAVLRNGVLPRVSFPLLAELSKDRQKRSTTARGNRIGPPNDVAFMQRRQLVDFVEKKLRCERHSKRLRFCATKSHQVGVCASWCFVCEQGCLLDLRTSKSMHGNDYELNALTNCGIVTCALSFARMEPFFRLLGVNPISTTDHYAFKADVEPILGAMAERSMAREHEHAVTKGDTDFFSIDGGFTAPRLAHGCTTDENGSRIVQPSFKLPSPYRLPAAQRQKRKPPAEGTRKYTTKAVSRAMDLLAQGEQASPRKRRVGVTDEQAQREAEAAEAAEVAAAGDEDLVEEESPADSLDGSDEDEDMD